jgi:hypothetical protein
MKQLLFLLLFPCLCVAQYTGNAGQKITLGEQTTADGLVYRGIRADTASKIVPFSDTSAYIILDTVEKTLWLYKAGQVPKWQQVGGSAGGGGVTSFSAGTTGLTPSTATTGAVTLGGTLAVANGGTNRTTMPAGYILHGDGTSVDTSVNLFWDRTNSRLGIGTASPESPFHLNATLDPDQFRITRLEQNNQGLSINAGAGRTYFLNYDGTNNVYPAYVFYSQKGDVILTRMTIETSGAVTINNLANASNPVNVQVDVNGTLVRTSSINIKEDVQNLPYGLNEIMLLQPSKFSYIDKYKYGEGYDIGFIAEDVINVIPEAVGTGVESDVFMDSVKLIPVLTKAIQEQQALIKALEQRIINLENK